MATLKKSYAQEEILIPCDLCGTSESASSYCKECFIHICDSCEQSHLRHTTVPVLEGLLHKLNLVNCSKHQQRYTNYCKTCRVNTCKICLKLYHRGHEYENVDIHGKKLRNSFSEKIKSKKSVVTKIHDIICLITKHKQDFEVQSEIQIDRVWSNITEMKKKLDAEGDEITKVLKLEQKEASEKFKKQSKELQDLCIKLINLTDSLEKQLKSIPDEAVLKFIDENETKFQSNPTKLTYELPKPSKFIPGMLLGSLTTFPPKRLDIELETAPLRRELEVVGMFTLTGSAVISISATGEDMFWIGTADCKLFLVDKEGRTNLKVELPGVPWHTAVTGPGDVLVSTRQDVIYKVTRQGQVIIFLDASPGKVYSMTSKQQGDLFACEVSDGNPYFYAECHLKFVTASGLVDSSVTRTGMLRKDTPTILWDDHDNILTGTRWDEYIHVFSGEGVFKRSYKVEGSLRIWALCLRKDGALLIGTEKGDVIVAKYLQ